MELLKKVNETIKKYSMLSQGDNILIGLSSGPDSVCLTIILDKLRGNFNLFLSAIYINHGLRPEESKKEESFCRGLCERLGIRFYSESVDVKEYTKQRKMNIQEAARELRYNVFKRYSLLIKANRIALGHNADDQAETMIMRLLRGTGRRGLAGIPPVRGKVIRPLIGVQRCEIEDFLSQQKPRVDFMVDSSNLKTDYLRNWIRFNLIPDLKQLNPSLIETLCRSSIILSEEDLYLETIVTKTMVRLVSKRDEGLIELFLVPLEGLARPIMRRVLIRAIGEIVPFRGIEFVHIEDIIKLIKCGKNGDMITLPRDLRAIKKYSTFLITTKEKVEIMPRVLGVPGEVYLEEINAIIRAEILSTMDDTADGKKRAVFDLDKLTLLLRIRRRREGDYFCPAGMAGRKKKLQDFFVDEKVPRHKRDTVPIVVSGDEIIWVAGYRMDERFKAGEETRKFLVLEIVE